MGKIVFDLNLFLSIFFIIYILEGIIVFQLFLPSWQDFCKKDPKNKKMFWAFFIYFGMFWFMGYLVAYPLLESKYPSIKR